MKIKKLKCSLSSLFNFLQTHAAQDYFLGRDIVLYHPYTMHNCFGHWRYDPVGQESYISSYYSIMEGTHITNKHDFWIWTVYQLSAHLVAFFINLFLYWLGKSHILRTAFLQVLNILLILGSGSTQASHPKKLQHC